jgi:polysaccharide chain length determinant protein (PEP-CTERM system associated)
MENTPTFHPLDYVSVLRRRVWWLTVPLVLAAVVGAALVMWLPRTYKTTATVGIALPTLSAELVTSASRVTPEDRLRGFQQVLMSGQVLERVAREEGLDQGRSLNQAVAYIRRGLAVDTRRDAAVPAGSYEQFFIAFTDSTPEMAQRVANRIADVFIEESSRNRELRAQDTSAFIKKQLDDNQARLDALEVRLRGAKETFMGALPEQTNANVAMATGLQQQLETTANAIRGEQDRLSVIERQVDAMKAGAPSDPSSPAPPVGVSEAAVRAVQLERELAVALGLYTDKHPEIVRLRDELATARTAAAADANRPEADRMASLSVDPSYRRLLTDAEQVRLRIRDLQRDEAQIRSRIDMYRARVEAAPRVEQQIATLQREYELERQQFVELTTKLRNAEMAESLVRSRGSEQFAVLARAGFPTIPATPNTQRLMVVALLLGACLGAGLALGREYLDRSVHDARAINDLDLPVLGEIPRIANA